MTQQKVLHWFDWFWPSTNNEQKKKKKYLAACPAQHAVPISLLSFSFLTMASAVTKPIQFCRIRLLTLSSRQRKEQRICLNEERQWPFCGRRFLFVYHISLFTMYC